MASLAILATLYYAKAVLLPITLAAVLALVLRPAVAWLRKQGLPTSVAATLVFALLLVVALGALFRLAEPAREWAKSAPKALDEVAERLRGVVKPLQDLQAATAEVSDIAKTPGESSPMAVRLEQPALTSEMLSTTGEYVAGVTITLALLYFLLLSGDRFLEKSVELAETFRGKRAVVSRVREIETKIASYLGAITAINAGLGVLIGLGLWWIGFPNPLLWGVVAGLLNYIPFAGLAVGVSLVTFTALATFESLSYALLAPMIYLLANGIESNLITPLVLGRSIDLNPVVILIAALVGGWIWGVVGVFLAVPLLIIAKVICDNSDDLRPVSVYLST